MAQPKVSKATQELRPATGIFMRGEVPKPLNEEEREWLFDQLAQWPNRVDETRTCAIGTLMELATAEFMNLMNERKAQHDCHRTVTTRRNVHKSS